MEWNDHILALILAVLYPLYAKFSYDRYKIRFKKEGPGRKVKGYIQTMAWLWALLALGALFWFMNGRSLGTLLIAPQDGILFYAGYGLAALFTVFTFYQYYGVKHANNDQLAKLRASLESIKDFLPLTRRELRLFYAVSITAGVTEEFLYRAFLIWYLIPLAGLTGAVIASSAIFGFAHFYQGPAGMVKTGLLGLVFALLYTLTGSILLVIALHAVFDMISGRVVHYALNKRQAG